MDKLPSVLLRGVDWGLISVLFIAPLFLGGRHPVGELVYVGLVGFTALCWRLRQCLTEQVDGARSGVELFLLACFAVLVLQLLPLPPSLLGLLSPSTAETLPLWFGDNQSPIQLGQWSTLSLTPESTRGTLALFLAHAMLFLVVCRRVRKREDVENLLRLVALAAIAMAVLGLAQFLLSNGRFLWVYEHPYRDTLRTVKGPFTNENHFAHFLALGVGPLLWWLHRRQREREQRRRGRSNRFATGGLTAGSDGPRYVTILLATGLGVVLFAGLLTFSRGGVLVMLLAVIVCGGLLAWRFPVDKRYTIAVGGIAGVVALALLIHGYQPLARELASLGAGSVDGIDHNAARQKLWAADLNAFRDYPLLGTGGGSHREVYPTYYPHYADCEYTHAESGYVQILLEFGLAGIGLLTVAIGTCGYWCVRAAFSANSSARAACGCALVAVFAASIIHSIWDFVWYIPACFSLTIVLAACACRLSQLLPQRRGCRRGARGETPDCDTEIRVPPGLRLGAALFVAAVSAFIIGDRTGPARASLHWDRYLILDDVVQNGERDRALARETNDALLWHVEQTLQCYPRHARANLCLASLCLQRFNIAQESSLNPMPLSQIRDAVRASRFPSPAARDQWLDVAVGENLGYLKRARQHTQRALALCPLQGDGYVYLAELDFLSDAGPPASAAYVRQATRVRPHSGAVQIAEGNEHARSGRPEEAIACWKKAFLDNPKYQAQLIELLGRQVPASFFLVEFEPDVDALERLYTYYREIGYDAEAREVGQHYAPQLEERARTKTGRLAAHYWQRAHKVYRFARDDARALKCIQQAVDAVPDNSHTRRTLAIELLACQRHEEASEHVRWCLRWRPDDPLLKRILAKARRGHLEQEGPTWQAQRESERDLR
jgi:O-antigen ligase/tetratricopeptide (TPR) repeat protein